MWFYRLLLRIFPRAMRIEFGAEMARMFDEQLRQTRTARRSVARLLLLATADAVRHGGAERLLAIGRRGRALVKELARWRWWMHAVAQDIRYAARLLFKQPAISAIAIVTLALGIGANTAIFSAVDVVLLRPLPYPDPDRLVRLYEKRVSEGVMENPVAPADYIDWARMQTSFEQVAALTVEHADLTGAGDAIRLSAGMVSTPFFDVLGVAPALGRTFRPEEGTMGQHRVAVLGHGLWQRRFGSDASIVSRSVLLNGEPHVVIAVLPATFEFPDAAIDLWVPLVLQGAPEPPSRVNHYLDVYARLKRGVSIEQARGEMDRIGAHLAQQYPQSNRRHSAHVLPLRDDLTQPFRTSLLLLLAAVSFVLLIACVNVANLLLARAASRRREMAVRAALGAGRARLAGQALTESVLLGLVGGAAGLVVARWGIDLLRMVAPRGVPVLGLEHLGLEPRVLLFAFLISVASGVLFGLLPAWQVAGQDVNDALKDGSRGGGRGVRRRLRLALVVSEIALASLLLVSAGLTLRSFHALLNTDGGFTTSGVLTALVSLPTVRYADDDRIVLTYIDIERRLAALSAVQSVGATSHLPLTGQDARAGIAVEGREPTDGSPTRAHLRAITPGYFRTMGMRLITGRNFTAAENGNTPFVAIVNETMAKRYWPGSSPLGRRVRLANGQAWREVVGIVADVKHWGLERPVNPEMYLPHGQIAWRSLNFVIATAADPSSLASQVREQLRLVDPELPLSNVRTMEQVAARSVAERRAGMLMLALFGGLALILAAAGIYGVMAHLVALRTSEIGIRMTLGAPPARVMSLVLKEGLLQTLIGLAIGVAGAVLVMRTFRAVLYQISPADPLTIAAVALLLAATATAACLVPARRAMRVDPVTALRAE